MATVNPQTGQDTLEAVHQSIEALANPPVYQVPEELVRGNIDRLVTLFAHEAESCRTFEQFSLLRQSVESSIHAIARLLGCSILYPKTPLEDYIQFQLGHLSRIPFKKKPQYIKAAIAFLFFAALFLYFVKSQLPLAYFIAIYFFTKSVAVLFTSGFIDAFMEAFRKNRKASKDDTTLTA